MRSLELLDTYDSAAACLPHQTDLGGAFQKRDDGMMNFVNDEITLSRSVIVLKREECESKGWRRLLLNKLTILRFNRDTVS